MSLKQLFNKSITVAGKSASGVSNQIEKHIRKKAIGRLHKKLEELGISVSEIESDDYEAMVSDHVKDIKKEYAANTAKGLLVVLGLDFLGGL